MKDNTTITLSRDNHKDLMLFKIQSDAKSINEVLGVLIEKLKAEQNGEQITSDSPESVKEKEDKDEI